MSYMQLICEQRYTIYVLKQRGVTQTEIGFGNINCVRSPTQGELQVYPLCSMSDSRVVFLPSGHNDPQPFPVISALPS